jgi:S1-C subfamily serine protease
MTLTANDSRDRRSRVLLWAWWATFALLLLAIAGFAIYLALRKPDTVYRDLPPPPPDAQQQTLLDQARSRGEDLRKEIAAIRAALAAYACPPGTIKDPTAPAVPLPPGDNGTMAPGSNGQQGLNSAPLPQQEEVTNTAAVGTVATGGGQHPLGQRALVDLLSHAVVLVLTENSSASGFFIAPNFVVTNRHAVEGAKDGQVGITSKTLAQLHIGRVVAMTPEGPKGAADYAIVRLDDVQSEAVLPLSLAHDALTPIVSAGYPGLTIVNDAGFRRLVSGDASAAPELVLSRGEVQAVQQSPSGTEVLVHSGDVMQGSSGGPIVDTCGRAIGMNTYIAVDEQQSGRVSYALSARSLESFVRHAGVPLTVQETPCSN